MLTVGKAFINVPYSPAKVEVDQTVTISVRLHQPDITSSQRPTGQLTPTRNSSTQPFDFSKHQPFPCREIVRNTEYEIYNLANISSR